MVFFLFSCSFFVTTLFSPSARSALVRIASRASLRRDNSPSSPSERDTAAERAASATSAADAPLARARAVACSRSLLRCTCASNSAMRASVCARAAPSVWSRATMSCRLRRKEASSCPFAASSPDMTVCCCALRACASACCRCKRDSSASTCCVIALLAVRTFAITS